MAAPQKQNEIKHAVYHNAPGLPVPLRRAHNTVVGGRKAHFVHAAPRTGLKATPRKALKVLLDQPLSPCVAAPLARVSSAWLLGCKLSDKHENAWQCLQVAKAFPLKNSNLQNKGRYGHLAEDIMTTQHGPDRIFKVLACARVGGGGGGGGACGGVFVFESGDGCVSAVRASVKSKR